ncbi:MAG: hypothetical protein CSB13_10315 [Chloroflexi bacterium]|nr:MAG: hypothetical protein CSB13_10315 [Chloroflexota bacterium]
MATSKSKKSPLPKLVQYALKGVAHAITPFPDTMRDAEEIAAWLGVSPAQVFKTLVVLLPNSEKKKYLVMVAANQQLNLKLFASAVGEKKLVMASHTQAEKLTGLQVGGISALALPHKNFKVYLDESANKFEKIFVSGGKRGLDLEIAVSDLVQITKAKFVKAA